MYSWYIANTQLRNWETLIFLTLTNEQCLQSQLSMSAALIKIYTSSKIPESRLLNSLLADCLDFGMWSERHGSLMFVLRWTGWPGQLSFNNKNRVGEGKVDQKHTRMGWEISINGIPHFYWHDMCQKATIGHVSWGVVSHEMKEAKKSCGKLWIKATN